MMRFAKTIWDFVTEADSRAAEAASGLTDAARNFLRMEAAGGILLVLAALAALVVANSPFYGLYDHVLNGLKFRIGFNDTVGTFDFEIRKSILLWINDGLMAVFFFLVGLEIKREVVEGAFSSFKKAILPLLAALGGVAVPAAVFWFINRESPETMQGWAIPAATDIAFALGVLGLLGSRVPVSLKILLTAIAVIDDIAAILIIAFFYTHEIHYTPLYYAAAALVVLLGLNRRRVMALTPYIICGLVLWVAVLESGIHATLAGVLTALFIPVRDSARPDHSPCNAMEHALHPWVAYGVLPVFAFANAGVPFGGFGMQTFTDPLTLGIVGGLVLGKQIGIFSVLFLVIKSGVLPGPRDVSWLQLYALSVLCGIGFTMSLFIGGLAFEDPQYQASLRLGVLMASTLSATGGYLLLRLFNPRSIPRQGKISGLKDISR